MGTSPVVMTARQQGKSNMSKLWLDTPFAPVYPLPEYIEFDCDPLALAVSMFNLGKNVCDVHTALYNYTRHGIIDPEHIDKALAIRKYYRNKLTMLILKKTQGKLSKFRTDLYDFLNNDSRKYDKALIPLIIKLPDFYAEDCAIDRLAKEYNSIDTNISKIDTTVEYVARVNRTTSRSKFSRYFFKTTQNYLVEVTVPNEQATGPMDFIAKLGTVRLKGQVFTKKFHDKDFVYATTNKHFEILPVGDTDE
jgi:hypothetical protein